MVQIAPVGRNDFGNRPAIAVDIARLDRYAPSELQVRRELLGPHDTDGVAVGSGDYLAGEVLA
jgi:hypothetical protein